MSSHWPKPGLGDVGAYQLSGIPFVTSSNGLECTSDGTVVRIKFPRVTRWFEVSVSGSGAANEKLRIGFTENGINGLGAVTGSQFTGVIDQWDNQVWTDTSPTPEAFDKANANANYFVLAPSTAAGSREAGMQATSRRFELMCTDLYLRADSTANVGFSIIAGLTGVERNQLVITGSRGMFGVG